ncbi:MAG: peptidylprolyl isomerase, partial [Cyclobacteriaceae bacterium]
MRFILISISLILLSLNTSAQEQVNIDKIIVKVDDYIVLKSDLEKAYLEFLSRGEFRGSNAKCQVLEQLVVNKMLVAKSVIDSVEVSDAEVQGNLSRRMEYMVSQVGSP